MLGILLIYFIGKEFYKLANFNGKNKWGYAVLGVFAYYLGTFVFGIFLAIYLELFSSTSIEEMNNLLINLIGLPFGLLSSWITYKLLERNINKKRTIEDPNLLDANIMEEDNNETNV